MTANLFNLSGRTALVTGSSAGIGLALARGLAQAGAAVVLNGRGEEKLAAAVAAMAADGLAVRSRAFDVTDAAAVDAGIDAVERDAGPIDILVNNAGMTRRAPLETLSVADWNAVLAADLTSAFLVGRRVAAGMIARRSGKIINICSLMSEVSRPGTGAYTAAKGGLKMLTRSMAVEWARHNVQANGIGPGYILTELTEPLAADPKFDAWVRGRTPAGRWGETADLVGAAVFLASPASDFVNGQILYVDGGILAAL